MQDRADDVADRALVVGARSHLDVHEQPEERASEIGAPDPAREVEPAIPAARKPARERLRPVPPRGVLGEHARTRAPQSRTWKHWTNSPIIEGDGDAASMRQYMLLIGVDEPLRSRMIGTYEDTLRREPDGWRFAYRKLVTHARAD